jgi:hypothetical protein
MLVAIYGQQITRLDVVQRRTLEERILQIRLRSVSTESVSIAHMSYDTNRHPAKD